MKRQKREIFVHQVEKKEKQPGSQIYCLCFFRACDDNNLVPSENSTPEKLQLAVA